MIIDFDVKDLIIHNNLQRMLNLFNKQFVINLF